MSPISYYPQRSKRQMVFRDLLGSFYRIHCHLAFYIGVCVWTVLLTPVALFSLVLPVDIAVVLARLWCRGILDLARVYLGLKYKVLGGEYLSAQGPQILACQHESAWETLVLCVLIKRPIFVLKAILLDVPVVGWMLWRLGMIPVRTGGGQQALIDHSAVQLEQGHTLIIFPQGTRVAPGQQVPYRKGIYKLAAAFPQVPVVPVALDSGVFWPRRGFFKRPGTITVQVLPPMPSGLDQPAFMEKIQHDLDTARQNLAKPADPFLHGGTQGKTIRYDKKNKS